MQAILLAGNAHAAKIMYGYLKSDPRYQICGCVVDDDYVNTSLLKDITSVGISQVADKFDLKKIHVIMATGYSSVNGIRASLFQRLKELGFIIETYVHPSSTIVTDSPIGEGSVVMPGVLVEPGAVIGKDTFVWGNAVIAHDAQISDHCWIAAGAVISGMAKIGCRSFIGVNATISNKVSIGAKNIVGASAFMSKNTKDNMVHLSRSGEPFRCSADEYAKYIGL